MWWIEFPFASNSHLFSFLNFNKQNCQLLPRAYFSDFCLHFLLVFPSSLFVLETNWHNWMLWTCISTVLLLILIALGRTGQVWQNTREMHRVGKTWICTPWVPWNKPRNIFECGKLGISFLSNFKSLSKCLWEWYLDTCISLTGNITISLK